MVEKEDIFIDAEITAASNVSLFPVNVQRTTSGQWNVIVELDMTIDLGDGRKVICKKQVKVRAQQEGKKPHPNPFGRKKKAV